MRYLKVHSEIPVPSVYMHDSTTRNPFGAPYIVMDFLPGSPVPVSDFDPQNLDQVAKVYDQICRISYKLLTLRFERIGSLYPSNNEGSVVIGPKDGFSGERYGPFDTAKEYHTALAQLYWDQSRNCALPQLPLPKTWEWASATTMEKDLFTAYLHIQCLSLVDYESDNFRFCFQHGELKLRNILVDAELNVVGVIDWDESSIVPTLSADPLSFCLENDDHIRICKELLAKCEAETESEESELGLSMSQRLWSTSATIARLLESSRLSYRICYAPRLFEHKYQVRWQDAGGLIHDCMEEAISAVIRDTNSNSC
jgi:hypothetical protein